MQKRVSTFTCVSMRVTHPGDENGHESTSDNMRRGQFREPHHWLFQMMHDQRSNRAASTGSEIQNSQCMKVHLHDQGAVLVAILIEGVQLCYRVIKCLVKKPMRMMVRRMVVWLLMKRKQIERLV